MSNSAETQPPKKKGGGKKKMVVILGAVLLLGGGGAAAGFYAAGSMSHPAGQTEDPYRPQLVLAGEKPEEVAKTWLAKTQGQPAPKTDGKGVDLPKPGNPAAYQTTYFQLPAPFTSNMVDSDGFAQVSIAVSTYYDQRVIEAVQTHELPLRSAILMMMAEEQQIDLMTPQGKEALQAKLVKVINDTLKAKTGYGGIDNVYFTNFVIQ
jgi:flagellar FliL protein